jgi:hypothetical protein
MKAWKSELPTLLALWTALGLSFAITTNRIDDTAMQIVMASLYVVTVLAITRLINARRA